MEATIIAKDMKCASFPNLALSTSAALMNVFLCLTLSARKQTLIIDLMLTLFHSCLIYFFLFVVVLCIFVLIYSVV